MIGLITSLEYFILSWVSLYIRTGSLWETADCVELDTDNSLLSDISTIHNVGFMHCKSVRVISAMPNWNWVVGGQEGSIRLCPLLQTQEEGLVVSTLPHSSVWLLRREALIGAPSPVKLLWLLHFKWSRPLHTLLTVLSSSGFKLQASWLIMHSPTHLLLSPSQHLSICTLHFVGLVTFSMDLQIILGYDDRRSIRSMKFANCHT